MKEADYYLNKIRIGFSDRDNLLTTEPLKNIDSILPLFEKNLSYADYINLNRLLRQKYILENPDDLLKDMNFNQIDLSSDTRVIYLMGSKREIIDFSEFEKLEKIFLVGARKVKKIILPENGSLQALGISSMNHLEEIANISEQKGLRYLHMDSKTKLPNLNFIRSLQQLVYLSFTANHDLPELDFIHPESQLAFLDFVDTNIFRYPSTIDYLKKLESLKFLTTGWTNKKMREALRKELPHICMRQG